MARRVGARVAAVGKRLPAVVALAMLAACSTPYQAEQEGGWFSRSGGFSERQIGPHSYYVVFAGNGRTSRETAERGFLRRAADLTLAGGGDFFIVTRSNLVVYPGGQVAQSRGIGGYGGSYAGAGYPTYGTGGAPGGVQALVPDVSPYEGPQAAGEILIFQGTAPADLPDAYDARRVLDD